MFDFLKTSRTTYNPNHVWNWIEGTEWMVDMDSIVINREKQTLSVLIAKQENFGFSCEYDTIVFSKDNSLKFCCEESSKWYRATNSNSNHNYNSAWYTFEQDSPVGKIYNRYQNEFHSRLPWQGNDYWHPVVHNNDFLRYSIDSVNYQGDEAYLIVCFPYAEGGRYEGYWCVDLVGKRICFFEESKFDNNNVRCWTKYSADYVRINNPLHNMLIEELISKKEAIIKAQKLHINSKENPHLELPCKDVSSWRLVTQGKGRVYYNIPSIDYSEENQRATVIIAEDQKKENLYTVERLLEIDFSTNTIKQLEAVVADGQTRKETYLDNKTFPLEGVFKKMADEIQNSKDTVLSGEGINVIRFRYKFASIVGMDSVKQELMKQYKTLMREKAEGKEISVHMIFMGDPGTGKTTIARIVAQMYDDLGIFSANKFVEVGRKDLIGEGLGSTAKLVEQKFREAEGGVLFIDEAYSLISERKGGFEQEAIDTLVQLVETKRNSCAVILAGYRKEMTDFLRMNPGLKSRFPKVIDFPDYTDDELTQIVIKMIEDGGYTLEDGCQKLIREGIAQERRKQGKYSGNARLARNYFEKIKEEQVARTSEEKSQEALHSITAQDIPKQGNRDDSYDLEGALNKVVGLDSVKETVKSLNNSILIARKRVEMGLPADQEQVLNMVFKGNPGTGKTMIARIFGDVFYNLGIISKNHFEEKSAHDLIEKYVGWTGKKVEEIFESARGGILFIDEAYSLMNGKGTTADFGQEAIDTLVKLIEDNHGTTIVILAGYPDEMDALMESNAGLSSRFPITIDFPDYSTDELLQIAKKMYEEKGYILDLLAEEAIKKKMESEKAEPHFGNARAVRNLFEKSKRNQNNRLIKDFGENLTKQQLMTILASDILEG